MNVSDNARAAHQELTRIWGSKPKVFRHGDGAEKNFIMIADHDDSPVRGVRAVGTLGLSDHDLGGGSLRVELVGAFPASFQEAPNIAATCAFNGFKDGLPIRPDSVHRNVMGLYLPKSTVPHVLLTDPFLWDDGPATLELGAMTIAWLMMVPISETELAFANSNGVGMLTSIFEERQIDIFDLNRMPVV
jgi:hypothetical protein